VAATVTSEPPNHGHFELEDDMSETLHYRYQADQAKRLARQVSDPQLRDRLLETADEYSRYASLIEARAAERPVIS
jgi:hypothetical protein